MPPKPRPPRDQQAWDALRADFPPVSGRRPRGTPIVRDGELAGLTAAERRSEIDRRRMVRRKAELEQADRDKRQRAAAATSDP